MEHAIRGKLKKSMHMWLLNKKTLCQLQTIFMYDFASGFLFREGHCYLKLSMPIKGLMYVFYDQSRQKLFKTRPRTET